MQYWIKGIGFVAFLSGIFTVLAFLLGQPGKDVDTMLGVQIVFFSNAIFGVAALRAPRTALVLGIGLLAVSAALVWFTKKPENLSEIFVPISWLMTLTCIGIVFNGTRHKKSKVHE